jgi:hypothetical protein
MKMLTFAAGLAVGYVLGTRAGREKYNQIVGVARNLADQPAVAQAQAKLKDLAGAGVDAVTAKISPEPGYDSTTPSAAANGTAPAPKKSTPAAKSTPAGEAPDVSPTL